MCAAAANVRCRRERAGLTGRARVAGLKPVGRSTKMAISAALARKGTLDFVALLFSLGCPMIDATRFLISASERFVGQCESATAPQWSYRPSLSDWSMGDVAEHLTIANGNIAKRLSTLRSLGDSQCDLIDDEIPYLFYRGDEPPNVATPTGAWNSWIEHAEDYRRSVSAILHAATNAQHDLRTYGAPHPVFRMLDDVQWVMFAGSHTDRH